MSYKSHNQETTMKALVTGGSGFIGTEIVSYLINSGYTVKNIDIQKPILRNQDEYWQYCDIRDRSTLTSCFTDFQPNYVIHLAAETHAEGKHIDEYSTNTDGTRCLLSVIKQQNSISRLIITSTQHVRRPGSGLPMHNEDFVPYGAYGESKVCTEKLTREANINCPWVIIRPTTIWGPNHSGLSKGLWRVIRKGFYFHPKNDNVVRSYGYVTNVAYQIEKLLTIETEIIDKKVLYVGDPCIKQIEWINEFSKSLTGTTVHEVPKILLRLLAYFGDIFKTVGLSFPIFTSRFRNMVSDNPVPVQLTLDICGDSPYSLKEGVEKTVKWLDNLE